MSRELSVIESFLPTIEQQFNSVTSDKSIVFARECEYALQLLSANEYTAQVAASNKDSLRHAISNVAAIGISLNPAKRQAYLVPRKTKQGSNYVKVVCLDISYMGLIELAVSSGSVKWVQCELVRENDQFIPCLAGERPIHKRDPFSDRGQVVGAYCVAKVGDNDYLTESMTIAEINAIRDRSDAWASGKSCPWRTDPEEMQRKTVIKRAYKYWPKTDRMSQAVNVLDTGADYINLNGNEDDVFDTEEFVGRARSATSEEMLSKAYSDMLAKALSMKINVKNNKDISDAKRKIIEIREEHRRNNYGVVEGEASSVETA